MTKRRPSSSLSRSNSVSGSNIPLSPPTTQVVDAKLLHLVKKLVGYPQIASSTSVQHVTNLLKTQHREYQRKDPSWLSKNVERVIQKLKEESNNNSSSSSNNNNNNKGSGTKRKRSGPPDPKEEEASNEQDDQYDREAQQHDVRREKALQSNSSMSLNASLQNRYKQVSKERDEQAAKEATKEATKSKKGRKRKAFLKDLDASNGTKPDAFLTPVARPSERYSDLGGMSTVLKQIRQLMEYPLVRPELYQHLGVDPPRGVLLRGPPGCGKTHLANAIAGQLNIPYFRVSAPELVGGMSGESEAKIRQLFQVASDMAPSLIFMDELDAVAPKRSDGNRGMEKRMVAQLLTCMDAVAPQHNQNQACVMVLGATNRPDSIDPALRRAGRFDKEIILGVPDEEARKAILQTMTKTMRLSGGFDFKALARKTPGFVGADIRSLTKEAAVIAINRIFRDVLTEEAMPSEIFERAKKQSSSEDPEATSGTTESNGRPNEADDKSQLARVGAITPLSAEQMEPLFVTMEDFLEAIPLVQPSSKREGFATVPDVSWDDIGALQSVREELTLSVLEPIRNPEKFKALGLSLPAGVLLYGPPGCGKTLLAKAIANESGANFLSVKGPELLDKYVGESERAVRLVFERARASSPCVVFFDELDSLCPKRGSDTGGGGVSERVVNQLLTEMDGLESRRSVFVIAATNRPELIDPAMMRPGRLDKLLYVPLPTPDDRASILGAVSGNIVLGKDVDLGEIGRSLRADGYSGADCTALLREAGLAVLKESMIQSNVEMCITRRHFDYAFDHVLPSVSKRDQARYDRMRDRMARARSRGGVADANSTPDNIKSTDEPTEPGT